MSVVDSIMNSVEGVVDNYRDWKVGITDSPTDRCALQGQPADWHTWHARSEVAATVILQYLEQRGMRSDTDQDDLSSYVYIYKK